MGADPAVIAERDAFLAAALQPYRDVGPVDVVLPGPAYHHRMLAHAHVGADVAVMDDAVAADIRVGPDRDIAVDEDRAELDDDVPATVREGEAIELGADNDTEHVRDQAEKLGNGAEDHVRREDQVRGAAELCKRPN